MTHVSELAEAWRATLKEVDREDVPWARTSRLHNERWAIGEKLLTTPSSGLEDISLKLNWLTEQDLDRSRVKSALRCVIADLERLKR